MQRALSQTSADGDPYDAGKSNVRTYLFRDYTEALTKAHGVRQAYPDFSLEMIQSIARENINPEFLQLT